MDWSDVKKNVVTVKPSREVEREVHDDFLRILTPPDE